MKIPWSMTWEECCNKAASFANITNVYPDIKNRLELAEHFIVVNGHGDGTFGIESFEVCGETVEYINTGDTYTLTVCMAEDGKCIAACWGDLLEEIETEYAKKTKKDKCDWCGEWGDADIACDCGKDRQHGWQ